MIDFSKIRLMSKTNLENQRVLIREDFNVPLENGKITDDTRILAALPTIKAALQAKAKNIILCSHFGRPEEGKFDSAFSLEIVAKKLSELLKEPVPLIKNFESENNFPKISLLENVRFNVGENKNTEALSKKYAALCDVFVMDAFATAHRAQASTEGVAHFAKVKCAGPLLAAELHALSKAFAHPERPVLAIVGGSKVSTKIELLENLLAKVNVLFVGGGIANTFLAATGVNVGKSLYEKDWLDKAKNLLENAKNMGVEIPLPVDVVVAKEFSPTAKATYKSLTEIENDDMILDVGPNTMRLYAPFIEEAKTIVWNGPLGVFEFAAFEEGTKILARKIARSGAFSLAGGGDTLAALAKFELTDQMSYVSTGGGAFLEFLEGKDLPGVSALCT